MNVDTIADVWGHP